MTILELKVMGIILTINIDSTLIKLAAVVQPSLSMIVNAFAGVVAFHNINPEWVTFIAY